MIQMRATTPYIFHLISVVISAFQKFSTVLPHLKKYDIYLLNGIATGASSQCVVNEFLSVNNIHVSYTHTHTHITFYILSPHGQLDSGLDSLSCDI